MHNDCILCNFICIMIELHLFKRHKMTANSNSMQITFCLMNLWLILTFLYNIWCLRHVSHSPCGAFVSWPSFFFVICNLIKEKLMTVINQRCPLYFIKCVRSLIGCSLGLTDAFHMIYMLREVYSFSHDTQKKCC